MNDALRIELKRWDISVSMIAPDMVVTPIWGKIMDTAFDMGKHLSRPVRKLYKEDLAAMWQMSQKADKTGMHVDRVVRAVRHALTARRPRNALSGRPPDRSRILGWSEPARPTQRLVCATPNGNEVNACRLRALVAFSASGVLVHRNGRVHVSTPYGQNVATTFKCVCLYRLCLAATLDSDLSITTFWTFPRTLAKNLPMCVMPTVRAQRFRQRR